MPARRQRATKASPPAVQRASRTTSRGARPRGRPAGSEDATRSEPALAVQHNVWIEAGGGVVLSLWRAHFLEAIASAGSINAAAAQLNVSYHRAWEKLHEMEVRLGVQLVETQTGGAHGGGARLTPAGQEYLRRFHAFYDGLPELIERRFRKAFR